MPTINCTKDYAACCCARCSVVRRFALNQHNELKTGVASLPDNAWPAQLRARIKAKAAEQREKDRRQLMIDRDII